MGVVEVIRIWGKRFVLDKGCFVPFFNFFFGVFTEEGVLMRWDLSKLDKTKVRGWASA
jgi:hypothetical protein